MVIASDSSPVDWLSECLERLERLGNLQHNWDSYGASAVNELSIFLTRQLLTILACLEAVEKTVVSASPAGNVTLSWEDGQRSFDVEILPDGCFQYIYINSQDETQDDEGLTSDVEVIMERLARV